MNNTRCLQTWSYRIIYIQARFVRTISKSPSGKPRHETHVDNITNTNTNLRFSQRMIHTMDKNRTTSSYPYTHASGTNNGNHSIAILPWRLLFFHYWWFFEHSFNLIGSMLYKTTKNTPTETSNSVTTTQANFLEWKSDAQQPLRQDDWTRQIIHALWDPFIITRAFAWQTHLFFLTGSYIPWCTLGKCNTYSTVVMQHHSHASNQQRETNRTQHINPKISIAPLRCVKTKILLDRFVRLGRTFQRF